MPRRKGNANQIAFLAAFAVSGQIAKAAKDAGVDRGAHYDWLRHDWYREAFAAAQTKAGDSLEDEATRRAHEGVLQAEWYQGKACGTKRVYSDGLMMFLLRGLKPEKFRQGVELTGANGGPVQVASLAEILRERRARRGADAPGRDPLDEA